MTRGTNHDRALGARAGFVFEKMAEGRIDAVHPEDRHEAEAFWRWLGTFERPVTETAGTAPARPAAWRRPVWWAAAASLALMISGGGFVAFGPDPAAGEVHASARGERRTIALGDGSVVKLGGASRIEVLYSARERRIRLVAGEALFDVAHNRVRPFIVAVPHGEIKAVGTAFDVRLNPSDAQVTVVDGIVRIAMTAGNAGGESARDAILKDARRGEQIRFGTRTDGRASIGFISETDDVDIGNATAWTRGKLYFQGESLEEAIAVVNRYAHAPIALKNPALAQTPIYGVFDQGDTTALQKLMDEL